MKFSRKAKENFCKKENGKFSLFSLAWDKFGDVNKNKIKSKEVAKLEVVF